MIDNIYFFDRKASEIDKFSTKPGWKYPDDGTIFDEEQSVRWNREKLASEQERWHAEKDALVAKKGEMWKAFHQEITHWIMEQIDVSEKVASKIWGYSDWNFDKCADYMTLYYELREIENEE